MKTWSRVVVFVAVFAVAALTAPGETPAPELELAAPATANASLAGPEPAELGWQEDYGTCYLSCGENWEQYPVDFQTYDGCCNQLHLCPDSSYPMSKYWSPYQGWPLLCMS